MAETASISALSNLLRELNTARRQRGMEEIAFSLPPAGSLMKVEHITAIYDAIPKNTDNIEYKKEPFEYPLPGSLILKKNIDFISQMRNDLDDGLDCISCANICVSSCASTCANNCGANCLKSCGENGCASSCSGKTCTQSCSRRCGHNCTGACTDGYCWFLFIAPCVNDDCAQNCYAGCSGGCSGKCSNACSDSCISSCKTGCGECASSCANECNSECHGSCQRGCEVDCSFSARAGSVL